MTPRIYVCEKTVHIRKEVYFVASLHSVPFSEVAPVEDIELAKLLPLYACIMHIIHIYIYCAQYV